MDVTIICDDAAKTEIMKAELTKYLGHGVGIIRTRTTDKFDRYRNRAIMFIEHDLETFPNNFFLDEPADVARQIDTAIEVLNVEVDDEV